MFTPRLSPTVSGYAMPSIWPVVPIIAGAATIPAVGAPWPAEPLTELILSRIVAEINDNPILDGITISGGDPFYNPFALLALLRRLKEETHKNVWCYTGYTYESLLKDETRRPCLDYIDTLVDGPFVQSLFDPALSFRGSSNQRILHLSKYR